MKKTILTLLASSCLFAAVPAAERDYSFLPDKVATYGNGAITREQSIRLLKSKFTPEELSTKSEGEIRTAVRELADIRFERVVMERILREHNVKPDPDAMLKELRHLHNSLPPAERSTIEKQLIDANGSFEAYLRKFTGEPENIIRYAFIQWVKQDTENKIIVTKEEVENFYRNRQSMFLIPETFVLSRIFVQEKADADALYTRLSLGEKFANLLKGRGGEYGEFARSDLDKEVLDAVDALKEGQYSKVTKHDNGWAIFHVNSRSKATFITLDEMKDFIENQIRLVKVQAEIQRILQAERKRLKFELNL